MPPAFLTSADFSFIPSLSASTLVRLWAAAYSNTAEPKPFWGVGGTQWWRAFAPVAAMAVLVASLSWTAAQLTSLPGERLATRTADPQSEPVSILAEYQLAERDLSNTIEGLERIAADDPAAADREKVFVFGMGKSR